MTNKTTQQQQAPPAESDDATIRVQATRPGYYDHIFRRPGDVFEVKPVIMSLTGDVIPASKQLSLDRTGSKGQFIRGWMKILGKGRPSKARRPALAAQTQAITPRTGPLSGKLPDDDLNVSDPIKDGDVL